MVKKEVKNKPKKRRKGLLIFGIIILVLIMAIGYAYFSIVSPVFVKKPEIERPSLADLLNSDGSIDQDAVIEEKHFEYILNEIGAYKLHNAPLQDEPPLMEIVLTDDTSAFSAIVRDNKLEINKGKSTNPDLRIKGSKETIIKLLQSPNVDNLLIRYNKEGKITIEILKDMKTLTLKGYKSIYDAFKT